MEKVESCGPYASLELPSSSPKAEWNEYTNNSTREYAVPPDAMSKPERDTTLESTNRTANTGIVAVPLAQASSKNSKAGKKKALQLKVAPGRKKPAPLALSNPTISNKKEDQPIVTQSASPTTSSSDMSSAPPPATSEVSTAVTKQESAGKGEQPFIPPASTQHQPATANAESVKAATGRLSVAELVKSLEKGTI